MRTTGDGRLERQAAPPRPREGHAGTHPAVEQGKRSAGLERGLITVGKGRVAAGPARHRRQHRQNHLCGKLLSGSHNSMLARHGAFGEQNPLQAPRLSVYNNGR
jgi:hypothetical protein